MGLAVARQCFFSTTPLNPSLWWSSPSNMQTNPPYFVLLTNQALSNCCRGICDDSRVTPRFWDEHVLYVSILLEMLEQIIRGDALIVEVHVNLLIATFCLKEIFLERTQHPIDQVLLLAHHLGHLLVAELDECVLGHAVPALHQVDRQHLYIFEIVPDHGFRGI